MMAPITDKPDTPEALIWGLEWHSRHEPDANISINPIERDALLRALKTMQTPSLSASDEARNAARYRWLRSEDTATNPLYYPFWQEFDFKLCREDAMDALIDSAMTSRLVVPKEPK